MSAVLFRALAHSPTVKPQEKSLVIPDHIYHRIVALNDSTNQFFLESIEICIIPTIEYVHILTQIKNKPGISAMLPCGLTFLVKITMKCLCANDTMENLKSFADKYGWKSCDNEWRNVVKRENVDLISIATPIYLHKEIAIEAAKNNATRFVTGLTFNEVSGNLQTLIKERPIDSNNAISPKGKVTVDDVAQFLVNFEDGATGYFESTRLATGRKNFNSIEVNREKGSLVWNFEDQNYLFFMTINSHIKKLVLRK